MTSRYKLPALEGGLNKLLSFLHYYRLLMVLLAVVGTVYLTYFVWNQSTEADKLKNAAVAVTCGSIIIGIFYSLINYENNQNKFKHDVKTSKELLTYNTACKMYDKEMLEHFRVAKIFYEKNKSLFVTGDSPAIDKLFESDWLSRQSLIVTLNYLEVISIGVNQGIIDEEFIKQFFLTIFKDNHGRYGPYLEGVRITRGSSIYSHFTTLAKSWTTSS